MRATSIERLLREGTLRLAGVGVHDARREARLLLGHALALRVEEVFAHPEREVAVDEVVCFHALIARRCEREPVARITGEREFWSLPLGISRATLDPRPDSETLVEVALERAVAMRGPLRLLDLGTGSGCLLLALLSELPEAWGIGVDVSEGAVRMARANARKHGLENRARFIAGNWGAGLAGSFDLIVSNPPYIPGAGLATLPPEVVGYDPVLALFGGEDGLEAYRALAPHAAGLLAPNGAVIVEIGAGQGDAVATIFGKYRLRCEAERPDLGGVTRCLVFARSPAPASAVRLQKKGLENRRFPTRVLAEKRRPTAPESADATPNPGQSGFCSGKRRSRVDDAGKRGA